MFLHIETIFLQYQNIINFHLVLNLVKVSAINKAHRASLPGRTKMLYLMRVADRVY